MMNRHTYRYQQVFVIGAAGIALCVLLGWLLGNGAMVRIVPGSSAMTLNTALMLLAAACGIWPTQEGHHGQGWRRLCAIFVILLSTLTLIEHGFAIDLGIDWPALHRTIHDGNLTPGRPPPNASIGLLMVGVALFGLLGNSKTSAQRTLIEVLALLAFLIGAAAVFGYLLNLEALYRYAAFNRMAAPTAFCLALVSAVLWINAGEQRRSAASTESPDQRIVRTAMAVLTVVTASAGLAGFAVLKNGFEQSLHQEFLRNARNTSNALQANVEQRINIGMTIAAQPGLQDSMQRLSKNPLDREALKLTHGIADSFRSSGVTGLQLFNTKGQLVDTVGELVGERAELSLPIYHLGQAAQLVWANGFVLRTDNPLMRDGVSVGRAVAEQRLPIMTALLQSAAKDSASSDMLICGREKDDAVCFPSRFYKVGLHIPMYKDGKPNLPISRALLNESGILTVRDLRGIEVLAAYTPLGELGLGMVLKRDSVDLYASISHYLNIFFVLLLLLVGGGTVLLRRQVLPLARKLIAEQAAMRSLGAQLEEAVKIGQLGIWTWNLSKDTLVWNDKMLEIYSVPDDVKKRSLLFEHWKASLHPDDMDAAVAKLMGAIDEANVYDPIFRIMRPDGSIRFIQAARAIQRDEHGKVQQMLGINRDITEQHEHEKLLAQAKLAAEAASRAKSDFLANMSHEIRTPMNAVFGMLQLLQQTAMDKRQRDYVDKTQGAAKALLGIINDILDFSKVEAGKMTLENRPFEIDRLLRDIGVVLGASVGDKDVEVLFDVDPALPDWVIGDALRLQQILINLGGNAIKFTQRGEVVLSVRVDTAAEGSSRMTVAVRDTGIGIPQDKLGHIFSGFSQADASTSRRFGGTGLGLAISQRLVRLMGGELVVDSVEGQGSTFHFSIPLEEGGAPETSTTPTALADMHGLQALIVDDNDSARRITKGLLDSFGWATEEAASGEDALAALERRQSNSLFFDVILIDWRMPGMDGWETSVKIRALFPAHHSPLIVMVTAHGREVLAQRQTELPQVLDGFLVKPVTASMLFDAIADARSAKQPGQVRTLQRAITVQRLSGVRLLVAEDNATNQQVAFELLSSEGAVVTIAANGQLALEVLQATRLPFDAVLMDVQMPVLDGYGATRAIRADLAMKELPVIAMTANAMLSDREEALASGMNDHVAKPFDLTELVAVIRRYVPGAADVTMSAASLPATGNDAGDASLLVLESAKAIARFGGRIEIYRRAVQSFLADAPALLLQLRDPLGADTTTTQRVVHTLKGMAATIGATKLANRLDEVERQSPQAIFDATASLDALAQEVFLLCAAYVATDRADAPERRAPPIAPLPRREELQALMALLHKGNMEATTVFETMQQRYGGPLPQAFSDLVNAMGRLDFKAAAQSCAKLIDTTVNL